MKFTLGTKEEMTQVFTEDGQVIPVTAISTGPLTVTQVRTPEKDGYTAVQVGFGQKRDGKVNKAMQGHFKDSGRVNYRYTIEFRLPAALATQAGLPDNADAPYTVGDVLEISELFAEGDVIEVSGITKGKGFQGVVKRHGFAGLSRTHGTKHHERSPGSIGAQGPQRVLKGTKMGGRMGSNRVTVKNLKVVQIDTENNKLLVSGAVPGKRGTLLEIRSTKKQAQSTK